MAEGSPPLILERGEKVETPPAWVFQGDADEWVPNEVAERLAAGWRKAGGEMELTLFPGEKHTFMRNYPGQAEFATGVGDAAGVHQAARVERVEAAARTKDKNKNKNSPSPCRRGPGQRCVPPSICGCTLPSPGPSLKGRRVLLETYSRLPCPHHGLSIGPSGATGARPHKGPPRKQGLSPMSALPRRAMLAGSAALPLFAIRTRPADAAEFSYKMANNVPVTHPLAVRQQEADQPHQAGHQRPAGHPALPEQPARLRHRHAVAASFRRASTCSPCPA